MSEGIGEAAQIVRVTMEGTELFVKAAYMSMKEIASLIIAYKSYKEKTMTGEIDLKKLLKAADGDIRLLKIPEDRKKEVADALKKYQIKYSLMPDLNLDDGKCELGFAVTDLPRVNSLIESLKLGEVITNADYIQNADPEILDKLADNIIEKEKLNEKKELATEEVADKRFISISKELIHEETEEAVKTRVPGTWGEDIRYLWLEKEKIKEIDDGKSLLTYLDKEKEYKLYNEDNEVADTLMGEKLGEEHYDSVNDEIIMQYAPSDTTVKKAEDFDMQARANQQAKENMSKTKIILPERCVVKKTDTQVKIKLPKDVCRQNYKKDAYIWIPIKNIQQDKENKKILLFADFGAKHMVCDRKDTIIDKMVSSRLKNVFEAQKTQKMDIAKKVTKKTISR